MRVKPIYSVLGENELPNGQLQRKKIYVANIS